MWQTIILILTSLPAIIKSFIEVWYLIKGVKDKERKSQKLSELRSVSKWVFKEPRYVKHELKRMKHRLIGQP